MNILFEAASVLAIVLLLVPPLFNFSCDVDYFLLPRIADLRTPQKK